MKKPNDLYAISRIDQPEKKNHGWYVRISVRRIISRKFFADNPHGGKAKALKRAKEHRDSLVATLSPARQARAEKAKKRTRKPKTSQK
jgi:hypothetical protein